MVSSHTHAYTHTHTADTHTHTHTCIPCDAGDAIGVTSVSFKLVLLVLVAKVGGIRRPRRRGPLDSGTGLATDITVSAGLDFVWRRYTAAAMATMTATAATTPPSSAGLLVTSLQLCLSLIDHHARHNVCNH